MIYMSKIAKNLTDLIGNTPLLELSNYGKQSNVITPVIANLSNSGFIWPWLSFYNQPIITVVDKMVL